MYKSIINSRVYDFIDETPLEFAPVNSKQLKNRISLKREDLHKVFSFKIRGAYNKIASLSKEEKNVGILAASAGNHAQGVAASAQHLGISATIIMPSTTPSIKVNAVKSWGAEVILHGENYSEAAEFCDLYQAQHQKSYIHPFDDLDVIAGQGTIGLELLKQSSGKIDAIFVPIGGGGLIAGVAALIKEFRPDIKIIGVEPEDSSAMKQSIEQGHRIELKRVGIFADGVAVKKVGEHTFKFVQDFVDSIVTVNTDEICSAIKMVYQDTRTIAEPAGALALAGLKKYVQENHIVNQDLICIVSGANMNFERLSFVAERTRIGEKQEALFSIALDEIPGALKTLCTEVLKDKNITEFNYRKGGEKQAQIFVGIGVENHRELAYIERKLNDSKYHCKNLTDNNLAKTHIRHMIGSRSVKIEEERLFQFWFPERVGALEKFLNTLGSDFNISLFHYRSIGGDFSQVLVGLEVSTETKNNLDEVLEQLKYPFIEETDNPAYKAFLMGE